MNDGCTRAALPRPERAAASRTPRRRRPVAAPPPASGRGGRPRLFAGAAVGVGGRVAAQVVQGVGEPVAAATPAAPSPCTFTAKSSSPGAVSTSPWWRSGSMPRHPKVTVHVVFVCSGNICRSPIAEKVLRRRAGAGRAGRAGAGEQRGHRRLARRRPRRPPRRRRAARRRATPPTTGPGRWTPSRWAPTCIVALDDTPPAAPCAATVPEPERVRLLRSFDPAAPDGPRCPTPTTATTTGSPRCSP